MEQEQTPTADAGEALTPEIVEEIINVPQTRTEMIDEDGFIWVLETGEVIGHVKEREVVEDRFKIESTEAAEWVLQLRSEAEGKVLGLVARKAALIEQMDKVIAKSMRRISYWDFRFRDELIAWARTQLKGKEKTLQLAWASISFRESRGSNVIVSDEEALRYVETYAPQLVKVKRSVGIKEVLEAKKIAESITDEKQGELGFMKHTGPSETVKISTGISIERDNRS